MKKAKLYVRAAMVDDEITIKASTKVNHEALSKYHGRTKYIFPTIYFAVDFDLPEKLFEQAEKVLATIDVDSDKVKIASTVVVPE